MRKSKTKKTPEATVDDRDQRSQQVLELATTDPDLLCTTVREALSELSEDELRAAHYALLSALRRAGLNIGRHLLVLGIPARTVEELTAPEIATLIRYVRISEPRVMTALAPILIDVLGKHATPAQRVPVRTRAA